MLTDIQEQELILLLQNSKAFTDRLDKVDLVLAGKAKQAFRCSHSGLYFPADYIQQWGRKYGIGLGSSPVSECLDSDYTADLPDPRNVENMDQVMFPVGNTFAQIDLVYIPETVFEENKLLHAITDPKMNARAALIRERQLTNGKGKRLQSMINGSK